MANTSNDILVADEKFLQFGGGSPKEENPVVRANILAAISTAPLAHYTTQEEQLRNLNFKIDPREVPKALRADMPPLPVADEQINMVFTAGASGAIDLTFRYLRWVVDHFHPKCELVLPPAVIVAAPTYGLLVDLARMHDFHVEFLPLQETKGWRSSADNLHESLREIYQKKDLLPVALLDVSPHNPTGKLRTFENAEANYLALQRTLHTRWEMMKSIAGGERRFNSLMAEDKQFRYAANFLMRPKIIDDLAYAGLEHGSKYGTPYLALAAKNPQIVDDVFTVASASKSGAAATRAGLLLTSQRHYGNLVNIIYRASDAPSPVVPPTLEAVFSRAENFTTCRDPYMSKRRNDLRHSALFARTLINGTEDTKIAARDMQRIKKELERFGIEGPNPPLPYVKILRAGDAAGMFHLVEFDQDYWKNVIDFKTPEILGHHSIR